MGIRAKIQALLYDPERHARRLSFVRIDPEGHLMPSAKFEFHNGEASFRGDVRIDADTLVGSTFVFESDEGKVAIGRGTFVNGGTRFICRSRITLGQHVTVAWGCTFYDHNSHSFDYRERQKDQRKQLENFRAGRATFGNKNWDIVKTAEIVVQDNAWIGFDCVILSGVTIGEGAIVGARSVVRNDVEPWTVVAGNPAVVIRKLER